MKLISEHHQGDAPTMQVRGLAPIPLLRDIDRTVTDERLSAEDARILALESGNVRGHTCKLIVFDGEHGVEELRDHLSHRIPAVPRLRQRLAAAPPGLPKWVDDTDFSLEHHVRACGPADDAELRRLVGEVMTEPLDRDRPLWAMDVVSPLAGGRTALIWRIHHAMADGMTAMRMARELLLDPAGTELGRLVPHGGCRAPVSRRGRRGRTSRRAIARGPAAGARPTRLRFAARPARGAAPRGRVRRCAGRGAEADRARRARARDGERRGARRGGRRTPGLA